MARLVTLVANLLLRAVWTVSRDVTKLTTDVTLGTVTPAVLGQMVWTTTLVAGDSTVVTTGTSTTSTTPMELPLLLWFWTILGDMTSLVAVVAALDGALTLHVTDLTTVVALLMLVSLW